MEQIIIKHFVKQSKSVEYKINKIAVAVSHVMLVECKNV